MRIAVIRALQIGDLLCAVPALRALRAAWPNAQIVLVGLPWARDFARRFRRYVDEFVALPGYPGLPDYPCDEATLPAVLAGLRERRFDLAIQMHGSGEIMNGVLARLEARRSAGFYRPGQPCPDAARFLAWHDHEHEV